MATFEQFLRAAYEGNLPELNALLAQGGFDPSLNNNEALRAGLLSGHIETFRLLLSIEAVRDNAHIDHNSILKSAALAGRHQSVQLLLSIDAVRNDIENCFLALQLAALNERIDVIVIILLNTRVYEHEDFQDFIKKHEILTNIWNSIARERRAIFEIAIHMKRELCLDENHRSNFGTLALEEAFEVLTLFPSVKTMVKQNNEGAASCSSADAVSDTMLLNVMFQKAAVFAFACKKYAKTLACEEASTSNETPVKECRQERP